MNVDYSVESKFNLSYSTLSRQIVRILSANARTSISEMAEELKTSRTTISKKIKAMQQELGMKYTLELDERALGLDSPHMILVKFKKKPDYAHIADLLKRSYIPQVAAKVHGTYDMFIYANALSSMDYAHWDRSMRILLSMYGAHWQPSEVVHKQLGFIPLRNEILQKVNIDDKYKKILMLLNEDSSLSVQDLSRKTGINFNTVAYTLNKIFKTGYIKRPTVTLDLVKNASFTTFFSRYAPLEGYENSSQKARLAFISDDENSLISRYLLCAPLVGSFDFFTLAVFDDEHTAYKHDIQYHRETMKKHHANLLYGEVKEIILGRLPIRSVDTKREYKPMIWTTELE